MRSLLSEGKNCWRVARTERFAWLIDGEAYFRALRECLEHAKHEILVVGWDIDSRVELVRDPDSPYHPSPLAKTLEHLVERNRQLRVHVLSWDFAMVYLLERELLPAFRFGWHSNDRLHFHLDNRHAVGASHHQKFVVIDGAIAFVGGLDLTKNRWDTPEHVADDPRRVNPSGEAYRPFHDVQAIVSGDIASKLRALAASRWHNATDETLPELNATRESPSHWPASVDAKARDIPAGIARTWVPADADDACREAEQLYVDMIEVAQRYIYIENQYFTSDTVTDALCRRLEQAQGPEIVIVLPKETSGWLEQVTMETLRNRCLTRLRSADGHGRLAVAAPVSAQLNDESINVHSKLMIVDGHWIRIGSANISGRSMGLDSECDLIVEIEDRSVANGMCAELLAEHVGADREHVRELLDARGILAVLAKYHGGERELRPIDVELNDQDDSLVPVARIADLEAPIEESWSGTGHPSESFTKGADGHSITSVKMIQRAMLLLTITGVAAFIFWQLRQGLSGLDIATLVATLNASADHWAAPIAGVLAFVAGSFVIAPVTVMIAVCALLFDPWAASLCSTSGVLVAAAFNYAIARRFAAAVLAHVPDTMTDKMQAVAKSSDAWSVAGLRLIPIAPFTVFNLVAGACNVRFRDFLLGTLAGMGPGIFLICFTVDRARALVSHEPLLDPWIIGTMAACGVALITMRVLVKRPKN